MRVEFRRRCQECDYVIVVPENKVPEYGTEPSNSYKFKACPKCKSEAFDYGSHVSIPENDADREKLEESY